MEKKADLLPLKIDPATLMVLPYGFVPDWFMSDVLGAETSEGLDRRNKFIFNTTELILRQFVTYMKEEGFVFATQNPVEISHD